MEWASFTEYGGGACCVIIINGSLTALKCQQMLELSMFPKLSIERKS